LREGSRSRSLNEGTMSLPVVVSGAPLRPPTRWRSSPGVSAVRCHEPVFHPCGLEQIRSKFDQFVAVRRSPPSAAWSPREGSEAGSDLKGRGRLSRVGRLQDGLCKAPSTRMPAKGATGHVDPASPANAADSSPYAPPHTTVSPTTRINHNRPEPEESARNPRGIREESDARLRSPHRIQAASRLPSVVMPRVSRLLARWCSVQALSGTP
jgi:hypothetical protein